MKRKVFKPALVTIKDTVFTLCYLVNVTACHQHLAYHLKSVAEYFDPPDPVILQMRSCGIVQT